MIPQDFLASLERHQQEQDSQPDPSQEFVREQFQRVIASMGMSADNLRKFLEGYKPVVGNMPKIASPDDIKQLITVVKGLEKSLKPSKFDVSTVEVALKKINEAIEALKLNPSYNPEIKVSPTPVNVAAPVVKVDAPDLSSLEKTIRDNKPTPVDMSGLTQLMTDNLKATKTVTDTIKKLKFPVSNTPTDPLIYYLPADMDDAGTVQYYGYTDNKGAWYIRKFDTGASPKTVRFAFGQSNYATNFANRASLTYTVWGS